MKSSIYTSFVESKNYVGVFVLVLAICPEGLSDFLVVDLQGGVNYLCFIVQFI